MKKYLRSWFPLIAAVITVLATALPLSHVQAARLSSAGPSATYSLCFPYAPKDAGGDTGTLLITNAAASAVTLNVSLLAADGTQVASLPPSSLVSGATKAIDLAAVTGLPDGTYQVITTATGELVGAAHIHSVEGSVGVYRGLDCAAEPDSMFGVFYVDSPNGETSMLSVMNNSTSTATFKLELVDNSGTVVYTRPSLTVAPYGGIRFTSDDVPTSVFGQDGYGRVQVTSSAAGVSGVLANKRSNVITYANAMWGNQVAAAAIEPAGPTRNALPRLHDGSTDVGTAFTTQLFFVNAVNGPNTTNMSFYRDDGGQAATPRVETFNAGTARRYASVMPSGPTTASMVVGAQGPIAIQAEMVANGSASADQPAYSADSTVISAYATSFFIPGVVYDGDVVSVLAVQNLTGASGSVFVDLLNAGGSLAATVSGNVQPGAALTVDLRQVAGVAQPFYGTAHVRSQGGSVGQLDVYAKLAKSPLAQVEIVGADMAAAPGAAVDLKAVVAPASSTKPITYTWQADEQAPQVHVTAASQDVASFAWSSPGLKIVRVSAANAGGTAAAVHSVRVPAASAVSAEGAPLTLAHTAADGVSLQLDIPVDAAAPGYTLTLTPLSSRQIGAVNGAPATATLVGTGVLFDAFRGGEALPRFSLLAPAALRMRYTDGDVAGFDEATLRIWTLQNGTWVDAAETCSPASQYVRRPELNEIEVPICHLSPYALGVPGKLLYLPALGRGQQ